MTDQAESFQQTPIAGDFDNLGQFDRMLAMAGARPRWPAYAATAAVIAVAWVWLAFMAVSASTVTLPGNLGPGMGAFSSVSNWLGLEADATGWLAIVARLCTPQVGVGFSFMTFITVFAMWMTMSVAMMLPSAAPMFKTYGDIADVAARKGEPVVSLTVLALGYLTVWAVFAVLASGLQLALVGLNAAADPLLPVQGVAAGLLLVGAGAYQFSAFKNACLEKCRNPFSILFARWSNEPLQIFRLGIQQGGFCVGCCWALMLIMLVVGTMNLAWMAFFTLFAIVEKSGTSEVTSRITGGILIAWGTALAFIALLSA